MKTIRINPSAAQSLVITCRASEAVPNMQAVTAASIRMLGPTGTSSTLSATFTSTASTCTITHVFQDGDLAMAGGYRVRPILTVGGNQVSGSIDSFQVVGEWD